MVEPSSVVSSAALAARAGLSHPRPRVFPQEKEQRRPHRPAAGPAPAAAMLGAAHGAILWRLRAGGGGRAGGTRHRPRGPLSFLFWGEIQAFQSVVGPPDSRHIERAAGVSVAHVRRLPMLGGDGDFRVPQ